MAAIIVKSDDLKQGHHAHALQRAMNDLLFDPCESRHANTVHAIAEMVAGSIDDGRRDECTGEFFKVLPTRAILTISKNKMVLSIHVRRGQHTHYLNVSVDATKVDNLILRRNIESWDIFLKAENLKHPVPRWKDYMFELASSPSYGVFQYEYRFGHTALSGQ